MKTKLSNHLIMVFLGLTFLAATGCLETAKASDPSPPSTKVEAGTTPAPTPEVVTAQWITLKDITYDQRAQFFSGLRQMEAVVDDQIRILTAQRAAMTSSANTKDWDFAMQEMINARSYLKSTGEVLRKASPETWNQEKERVGLGWVRVQEAFAKAKSSTTT